jgi:hypothetical protein
MACESGVMKYFNSRAYAAFTGVRFHPDYDLSLELSTRLRRDQELDSVSKLVVCRLLWRYRRQISDQELLDYAASVTNL